MRRLTKIQKTLNIPLLIVTMPATLLAIVIATSLFSPPSIAAEKPVGPIANIPAPEMHVPEFEVFNRAFDQSSHSRFRDVAITSQVEDKKAEASLLVRNCRIETIELNAFDPVTSRPGRVQIRLYTPLKTAGILRQILLVPPTGGENIFDLGYADSFCTRGFQTAVLEHWDGDDVTSLDMNMHDVGAVRSIAAMRHTIEFLNADGSHALAIFGTSVGAIGSALAMGSDSRIRTAVLIVGGMGMSGIIARSHETTLTALREQRMMAFGYPDIETYQRALGLHVLIDPNDVLPSTNVKSVLMFIADQDVTVPTLNQLLLRDCLKDLGIPVTEFHFANDHFSTSKKTFLSFGNRRKIIDFLNANL